MSLLTVCEQRGLLLPFMLFDTFDPMCNYRRFSPAYSQLLQGRTFTFEIPSPTLLIIMPSDASCSTL